MSAVFLELFNRAVSAGWLLLALLILFAICPVVFSVIWVVRTVKGLVTKAAGAAGRKIEEKIEEEKEKHYVGGGI